MLARKLNSFLPLSEDDLSSLAELQSRPRRVKRGQNITYEGEIGHKAFVIQEGWACSFKSLPNGSRQIISFPLPGDCVGLRSTLLRKANLSFSALTEMIVAEVDAARILNYVKTPRISTAFLWAASRDEAMVVEHLASLGRRSAIERTAHFFMELAERLTLIGHVTDNQFRCPLTQYDLADALGLTAIHVNRVLRQLREQQLLTIRNGCATIHDLKALQRLAGYDGVYLFGDKKRPRETINGTGISCPR